MRLLNLITLFFCFQTHAGIVESSTKNISVLENIKEILGQSIHYSNQLPAEVNLKESLFEIKYNLRNELEAHIKRELKRYGPDYASVVVIDNDNGNILAALDFTKKSRSFGRALTFSSANPAASVFKVVTAANLLEEKKIEPETSFFYRGKGSTLYKYQLKEKKSRWRRKLRFKNAFASSNNVIFGKAALQNLTGVSLYQMANKLKFNTDILEEVNISKSLFSTPENKYNLAEMASGFNRITSMSPLHGAVLASIVANDGIYRRPSLLSSIKDKKNKKYIWFPDREVEKVLEKETADKLKDMMNLTVQKGTARAISRYFRRGKLKHLEIGGKTGSITGGIPYGKRDWFVSYAVPKEKDLGKGISVSVMIINVKKWYVKSTHLAKDVIEYYYQNLFPLRNFQE
jgi:peptidoglycan glycosyltransferase